MVAFGAVEFGGDGCGGGMGGGFGGGLGGGAGGGPMGVPGGGGGGSRRGLTTWYVVATSAEPSRGDAAAPASWSRREDEGGVEMRGNAQAVSRREEGRRAR